ncbi:NO-inducible flavohemoprotein [Peribacillus cavernae]|uniref:Flavohemoprotein n=1 Tax=Peribacillus cavernae TaxID=1674310 RepID=A0A3S0U2J2_9BACI|nr:NO-inducible flavohemoprotein [Peribacillus cavernae]MDQ0218007.1 nitric oxide dioxygenase [Peribacillus cavernae]RUQ28947.1 NO-inducible flavohemoprotein [Peribacillus cavernae]
MLSQQTIDIIKSTVPVLEVKGTEITTVFYKNLFENHPELLHIFNHANQKRGRQQTALANTVLAAAKYIDQLETIIPVVKQISHKHRSLAVKPEHYPIVGEHLLGAIKQVLGDAATDEIIGAWAEAYGVIAQVFIDIEKEMYQGTANQNNGWADYKDFKVIDKVKESDVITSFYLKPADDSNVPEFEPGQYITVRLQIPGEDYLFNRQYSLSIAPGKEYFRISVKKEAEGTIPDGKVSNYLHDHINTGDTIEVTAPAGDFTLDTEKETPVVFLSGGVGITPFMSMAGAVAEKQPGRQVQFIHAARYGSLQAFKEELKGLHDKLTNYQLAFVYEQPDEEDLQNEYFSKQGYIDAEWLKDRVAADADFYVCGPVPFLRAIIGSLKKLGIPDTRIHFEFFGPAENLEAEEATA